MTQAFDLVGITSKVGAPSFAFFAKGGNHELLRSWVYVERQSVVSAASYPPLHKTQGRGTHGVVGAKARKGWATLYNLVGIVKRHVECLGSAVSLREC